MAATLCLAMIVPTAGPSLSATATTSVPPDAVPWIGLGSVTSGVLFALLLRDTVAAVTTAPTPSPTASITAPTRTTLRRAPPPPDGWASQAGGCHTGGGVPQPVGQGEIAAAGGGGGGGGDEGAGAGWTGAPQGWVGGGGGAHGDAGVSGRPSAGSEPGFPHGCGSGCSGFVGGWSVP